MILIVSIPRLLSTTGRYRRRTLLVGTTRAGRDTPNALVAGLVAWENGATTSDGPGQSRQRLGLPDLTPSERG